MSTCLNSAEFSSCVVFLSSPLSSLFKQGGVVRTANQTLLTSELRSVAGFVLPVDEPLVSYKQFYAHYYVIPKIGERTAKYVDKQNKKLGRLVDEHFTWYIRWPTDQELTQAMVEDNEAAGTREVCTHMFLDSI